MTPERWHQLDELFHEALKLKPEHRAEFVENECVGDEMMRRELESLLANHESRWTLVDEPMFHLSARLSEGDNVGPYKIIGFLGEGGYGRVYLSEDPKLGRKIALKLLPPQFIKDENRLFRFVQEAQAASAPNHPNICTVYGVGETPDGLHYIAMEHIDGVPLRQCMSVGGMDVRKVLDIAIQVATALAAAHAAGVVHRDVKPENIMLRRADGIVKVLDFGIAKLLAPPDFNGPSDAGEGASAYVAGAVAAIKTKTGVEGLGTPLYMSPEQVQGQPVDARTDIWSLGVVLYEMITGRSPFRGRSKSHVEAKILRREPKPLAQYEVSFELQQIVMKALCKDKEGRYQTAEEMLNDLKSLQIKYANEFDDEDMKLFIAENSSYYLKKWKRSVVYNRPTFNWAGFFLTTIWMGYRRMYLYLNLITLNSLIIFLLFIYVSGSSYLITLKFFILLVFGLGGNGLYRAHTLKNLRDIKLKRLAPDQERGLIIQKGGTSVAGILIGIFYLFIIFLPASLADQPIQDIRSRELIAEGDELQRKAFGLMLDNQGAFNDPEAQHADETISMRSHRIMVLREIASTFRASADKYQQAAKIETLSKKRDVLSLLAQAMLNRAEYTDVTRQRIEEAFSENHGRQSQLKDRAAALDRELIELEKQLLKFVPKT